MKTLQKMKSLHKNPVFWGASVLVLGIGVFFTSLPFRGDLSADIIAPELCTFDLEATATMDGGTPDYKASQPIFMTAQPTWLWSNVTNAQSCMDSASKKVEWDWENDGIFDASQNVMNYENHVSSIYAEGVHTATVRVTWDGVERTKQVIVNANADGKADCGGTCNFNHSSCTVAPAGFTVWETADQSETDFPCYKRGLLSSVPAGQVCTFSGSVKNAGEIHMAPIELRIEGNNCGQSISYCDGLQDCSAKDFSVSCREGEVRVYVPSSCGWNPSSITDSSEISIVRNCNSASIDISKSATPAAIPLDGASNYTVVLTNISKLKIWYSNLRLIDMYDGGRMEITSINEPAGFNCVLTNKFPFGVIIQGGGPVPIPSEKKFIICSPGILPTGAALEPGASITLTYQGKGIEKGKAQNDALGIIGNVVMAKDVQDVYIGLNADLGVTKSADKEYASPGETVNYSIAVRNNGPETIKGEIHIEEAIDTKYMDVDIASQLPPGAVCTFSDTPPGSTVYEMRCVFKLTLDGFPAGETRVWTYAGTTRSDSTGSGGDAHNKVSVGYRATNGAIDTNPLNDNADVTVTVGPPGGQTVRVDKKASEDLIPLLGKVDYTVVVTPGENTTNDLIKLTDEYDSKLLSVDAGSISAWGMKCTNDDLKGLISCEGDSSPTAKLPTLTYSATGIAEGVAENTAIVTMGNESDTETVYVTIGGGTTPNIDIDKWALENQTYPPNGIHVGDTIHYHVDLRNIRAIGNPEIILTDDFDEARVRIVSINGSQFANCTALDIANVTGKIECHTNVNDRPEITLTYNVVVISGGEARNTATVTMAGLEKSDNEMVKIQRQADLLLEKWAISDVIAPNGTTAYHIKFTNLGPDVLDIPVSIKDIIDPGTASMIRGSLPAFCREDVPSNGMLCYPIGDETTGVTNPLSVGETVEFTYEGIAGETEGTVKNSAALDLLGSTPDTVTDPNISNNSTTEEVTVADNSVDLSVTKTADTQMVEIGGDIVYSISYDVVQNAVATNVVIVDDYDETHVRNIRDLQPGDRCRNDATAGVITCDIGSVSPMNLRYHITYTAEAYVLGDAVNTATISSEYPDPDQTNNASTVTVHIGNAVVTADLAIEKTGPNYAVYGETVNYTLTYMNSGPDDAEKVVIIDDYDEAKAEIVSIETNPADGVQCMDTKTQIECSIDFLNLDKNMRTINYKARIKGSGLIRNEAEIAFSGNDPEINNNTAVWEVNDVPLSADLEVVEKYIINPPAGPYYAGQELTYYVRYQNNGPEIATNVLLTDDYDEAVFDVVSLNDPDRCTDDKTKIICRFNAVSPYTEGGSENIKAISYVVRAKRTGKGVLNRAEIESTDMKDHDPDNNWKEFSVDIFGSADLELQKQVSNPTPNVGDQISYSIQFRNIGPLVVQGYEIEDRYDKTKLSFVSTSGLPAGLSCVNADDSTSANIGIIRCTCRLDLDACILNPSTSFSSYSYTMNVLNTGAASNTADISSLENIHDPLLGNNTDSITISIGIPPVPVFSVTKTADLALNPASPFIIPHGTVITYEVTVSNSSPSASGDVLLVDTITGRTNGGNLGPYENIEFIWNSGSGTYEEERVADANGGEIFRVLFHNFPAGGSMTIRYTRTAQGNGIPATQYSDITNSATLYVEP